MTAPSAPVRAPAATPGAALRALSSGGGNAAMARMVASLARDPAAAPPVDEAEKRAVEAARAAIAGPLMGLVRVLAGLGSDRARLQPKLAAEPQVDGKKLALAGRVCAVKEAPSTDAQVALGKELEAAGIPMQQRDEVYEHLGLSGLAAPSQIASFAADVKGAMGWLAQNKGFDARAGKLVGMVDAHLNAVGVPKLLSAKAGGAHELGSFHRDGWYMTVTPELGELDIAANADKAVSILTTFYHEARHAEQDFQLIRLVVAEHQGELNQVWAPIDVMEAAAAMGPPTGAQRALAESVRDSQYGPGNQAFEDRRAKLREEYDALKAKGASEAELKAKYDERYANYAGQAHESDAFGAEKRLKDQLGPGAGK